MKASTTTRSKYIRSVDGIFGKVESFKLVHEHHVMIEIGNSYFVSTKTYANEESARRAAKRLEAKL